MLYFSLNQQPLIPSNSWPVTYSSYRYHCLDQLAKNVFLEISFSHLFSLTQLQSSVLLILSNICVCCLFLCSTPKTFKSIDKTYKKNKDNIIIYAGTVLQCSSASSYFDIVAEQRRGSGARSKQAGGIHHLVALD